MLGFTTRTVRNVCVIRFGLLLSACSEAINTEQATERATEPAATANCGSQAWTDYERDTRPRLWEVNGMSLQRFIDLQHARPILKDDTAGFQIMRWDGPPNVDVMWFADDENAPGERLAARRWAVSGLVLHGFDRWFDVGATRAFAKIGKEKFMNTPSGIVALIPEGFDRRMPPWEGEIWPGYDDRCFENINQKFALFHHLMGAYESTQNPAGAMYVFKARTGGVPKELPYFALGIDALDLTSTHAQTYMYLERAVKNTQLTPEVIAWLKQVNKKLSNPSELRGLKNLVETLLSLVSLDQLRTWRLAEVDREPLPFSAQAIESWSERVVENFRSKVDRLLNAERFPTLAPANTGISASRKMRPSGSTSCH